MKPYVQVHRLIQEAGALLCTEGWKEFRCRQVPGGQLLTDLLKNTARPQRKPMPDSQALRMVRTGATILRTLCSTAPWPPPPQQLASTALEGANGSTCKKPSGGRAPWRWARAAPPSLRQRVLTRSLPSRPRGHQT